VRVVLQILPWSPWLVITFLNSRDNLYDTRPLGFWNLSGNQRAKWKRAVQNAVMPTVIKNWVRYINVINTGIRVSWGADEGDTISLTVNLESITFLSQWSERWREKKSHARKASPQDVVIGSFLSNLAIFTEKVPWERNNCVCLVMSVMSRLR
jgi:hypothetical protein